MRLSRTVAREPAARVGPAVALLPDPRGQAGGRVRQGVADGLRAGSLLERVAAVLRRLPASGTPGASRAWQGWRQWGQKQRAGDVPRSLLRDAGADAGAPVAAG